MQIFRGIAQQYSNLFGIGSEPGNEDSREPQEESESFEKRWSWIAVINNMSNNDRSKWDFYFDLNIIEFLNTVVFFKEKAEEDKKQWQKAQAKI